MTYRCGQVWVGELDGQGMYLLLRPVEPANDEDKQLERYLALDLLHGYTIKFIAIGLERSRGWARYR